MSVEAEKGQIYAPNGRTWKSIAFDETANAALLREEVMRLRAALHRITSPIWQMQQETPPGHSFDGAKARALITAEYLQGIARDALIASGERH